MTTKNMRWIAEQLERDLPKAKLDLLEPSGKGIGWTLDVEFRGHFVVVQWSPNTHFAIATPSDDDGYGAAATETYRDAEDTYDRVLYLLMTGERALSKRDRLQALREHRRVSQDVLAKALKVSQASVSKTERRQDILVSTLASYIEGLGGELVVIAKFPTENIQLDFPGSAPGD